MKKTIFICFSTSEGSLSDHFVYLSNILSKQYNIVIISDKKYFPRKLKKDVIIKFWPSNRPVYFKDFIFYFKLLKKHQPVMTISLFGSVNLNIITSYILNIKYRIAWVRSLSTQFHQNPIKVFRKSIVYKYATNIIANSYSTAIDASVVYNIKLKKIKVLSNSVINYYDDYKNLKVDNDKIVYVGRLHKTKGVNVLINSFGILARKYRNLKLIIIGNGPEENALRQLSINTGFYKRINFKGKKTKDEVLKEMKTSFASVVPSYSEAFGFTVIEAMSMKTCVIGSDNTGIKEIIKHEKTGLLFKTGNHKDLAEKIELVIENKELRNAYADEGYKRFKEKYCTESAVKRDANYFIKLIEKN